MEIKIKKEKGKEEKENLKERDRSVDKCLNKCTQFSTIEGIFRRSECCLTQIYFT